MPMEILGRINMPCIPTKKVHLEIMIPVLKAFYNDLKMIFHISQKRRMKAIKAFIVTNPFLIKQNHESHKKESNILIIC